MAILTTAEIHYMQEHINDDKQPRILAAAITTIIGAYIAVFLRFFTRKSSGVLLSSDDWWILVALVFATGGNVAHIVAVHYGLGRHVILVTNPEALIKSARAAQVLCSNTLVPIKISMLCLYRRIFTSKRYYITFLTVGAFVLSFSFVEAMVLIFQCIPLSSYWTGKPGKCINENAFFTVATIYDAITDLIIICLPIPVFWRLKIGYTQKIQLFGIFALGGCILVFGIIRSTKRHSSPWDPSWGDVDIAFWSVLEINVGVIGACLPTLRPLFSRNSRHRRSNPNELPPNSAGGIELPDKSTQCRVGFVDDSIKSDRNIKFLT